MSFWREPYAREVGDLGLDAMAHISNDEGVWLLLKAFKEGADNT